MIRILASARRDIEEAYAFYESKAAGLGDYFVNSLRSDIQNLKVIAGVHRLFWEHYHRMLCKKFPFAVYYTLQGSEILVFAVIDSRRDPAWVREYLGGSK